MAIQGSSRGVIPLSSCKRGGGFHMLDYANRTKSLREVFQECSPKQVASELGPVALDDLQVGRASRCLRRKRPALIRSTGSKRCFRVHETTDDWCSGFAQRAGGFLHPESEKPINRIRRT